MICQNCGQVAETVKIKLTENGETKTASLCTACAAQIGFHSPLDDQPFPLSAILSQMFETPELPLPESYPDLVCPNCFQTYEEFARDGRFGCGRCYDAFREKLIPLMSHLHGDSVHRGRVPESISNDGQIMREEERLNWELKAAIEREDYERAAELRDQLETIEH
jgi:protein arginine kinase activator